MSGIVEEDGKKNQAIIRTQSIEMEGLRSFIEIYESISSMPIEVKRTARAKLARKNIPPFDYYPHCTLPATGHKFQVKMDQNQKFILSRISPKQNQKGPLYTLPSDFRKSPDIILEHKQANEVMKYIHLTQQYLIQTEERVKSSNKGFVLIPLSLHQMYKEIETIFSTGWSDSNASQLEKLSKEILSFINDRTKELQQEARKLTKLVDIANQNRSTTPEHNLVFNNVLSNPEYNADNWQEGDMTAIYSQFLGDSTPNIFNKEFVRNILKNLVIDSLIPDLDSWTSENNSGGISISIKPLELRLTGDDANKDAEYDKIAEDLLPVKNALEEQQRKSQEIPQEAFDDCENIISSCSKKSELSNLIVNSPEKLEDRLSKIIKQYKLTSIMDKEIEINFPGFYMWCQEQEKEDENTTLSDIIEKYFIQLNSINNQLTMCEKRLREGNNLLIEKSVHKDVEHVRETYKASMDDIRVKIKDIRNQRTIAQLEERVSVVINEIETWLQQLDGALSGTPNNESLLWIGLGQAGGQILRECLMYSVTNLSDARCSALLTALGVGRRDKKDVYRDMKNIYSKDPNVKRDAEKELQTLFDEKVHMLAINLGEEIDGLVTKDQPGYFFWGKDIPREKSTKTVRTRRNVLKLIESGDGAGGATGLGRAYGFRFRQDISDVMKDIGRKGNRSPRHIVITHSLAGGSGSGMVLPVLQQARRTFGEEPVIWVISVGEGKSEEKSQAKVNTPFIISDILQAHFDGIHAIKDPIKLHHIRTFTRTISESYSQMEKEAKKVVQLCAENNKSKIDYDAENSLFKNLSYLLDGGHQGDKGNQELNNSLDCLTDLKELSGGNTFSNNGTTGVSLRDSNLLKIKEIKEELATVKIVDKSVNILPKTREDAKIFSTWCQQELIGGSRPAIHFWNRWVQLQKDPFSLFITGKTAIKQTQSDDEKVGQEDYFIPDLTGSHINSLLRYIFSTKDLKLNGLKVTGKSPTIGMEKLSEVLEQTYEEHGEERLNQLKEHLMNYARSLDNYNDALERMTSHILSLSGSGSDPAIKSIVVSNAHLEMGVSASNHIDASGKIYTVYNSVIFDLMLNIIGPQLPTEPGVFINTDAEEFDHRDMLGHTTPPLVVGLMNQRDSVSLNESVIVNKRRSALQEPIPTLLNAIISSKHINPNSKQTEPNLCFISNEQPDNKYLQMFQAIFGSRYKYMLGANPFEIIDITSTEIDKFCTNLMQIWDTDEAHVFDVSANERMNLADSEGIYSSHIANLIRWFSLIDPTMFASFISRGSKFDSTLDMINSNKTNIWNIIKNGKHLENLEFDIGVIRTANNLQQYNSEAELINENLLFRILPKMGIYNAEMLRAMSPSYINSFLPIAVILEMQNISSDLNIKKMPKSENLETKEEFDEFLEWAFKKIMEYNSHQTDGLIKLEEDDFEVFEGLSSELNYILNKIDLIAKFDQDGMYITPHPKLERYLSVMRDIPAKPEDRLLPSRSAPSSLARYLYSNSNEDLLDSNTNSNKRNGLASPTFNMGLDILNQMRTPALLPDEKRLSFVPLLRIILLSNQGSDKLITLVNNELSAMKIKAEEIKPYIDNIVGNNQYIALDGYKLPQSYSSQILTLVKRLHASEEFLNYLVEKLPAGWNNNDLIAINFVLEIIKSRTEIVPKDLDLANELYGNNVESIENVKEWIQDIFNLIRGEDNLTTEESKEEENENEKETISNENPSIVQVKQLFYDIASMTSEALRQAEYLDPNTQNAKSVHFEMTGFSDRLLGSPSGLMLLIHDRNPKLPLDSIQENVRDTLTHFISRFQNPKEYSTAADYGPNSYLTMVLTQAPAADIADQFYTLMHDDVIGLGGSDPFWSFKKSKLHPYILLYNLLWLSVNVIGKWSMASNKLYSRRFQIPTKVIQHHYSDPERIEQDRNRIENNKSDFKDEISMPKEDKDAYTNAVTDKENRLSGIRNIIKLIATMALRYDNLEPKIKHHDGILTDEEYIQIKKAIPMSTTDVEKDHLLEPKKSDQDGTAKVSTGRKFLKKNRQNNNINSQQDTIESRAKAWFTAYKAWIDYTAKIEPEGQSNDEGSTNQADSFTVSDVEEILLDSPKDDE
jgi:hypothetical protein